MPLLTLQRRQLFHQRFDAPLRGLFITRRGQKGVGPLRHVTAAAGSWAEMVDCVPSVMANANARPNLQSVKHMAIPLVRYRCRTGAGLARQGSPPRAAKNPQGAEEGGTRFFVACSNAYASSSSFGSLHCAPTNPTPNGAGLALKPGGRGGLGAFGTIPKGTAIIG